MPSIKTSSTTFLSTLTVCAELTGASFGPDCAHAAETTNTSPRISSAISEESFNRLFEKIPKANFGVTGETHPLLYVNDGLICARSLDGKSIAELFYGEYPAWSPNGRMIAAANLDLKVMQIISLQPAAAWSANGDPSKLEWSPDGTKIAYSEPGQTLDVFDLQNKTFYNLDTNLQNLRFEWVSTNNVVYLSAPLTSVATKGRNAFLDSRKKYDLDGLAVDIACSSAGDKFAAIGPDAIRVGTTDGKHLEPLPPLAEDVLPIFPRISQTLEWSPNGKMLAFTAIGPKLGETLVQGGVCVYDFETKKWSVVVPLTPHLHRSSWGPNSDKIFVEIFPPTSPPTKLKDGRDVLVQLSITSLRPKVFDATGISHTNGMQNDKIIGYDLNGKKVDSFDGHGLSVYKGKH